MGCVCINTRYRLAQTVAVAALCAQHGLHEEHNVPAQHIINMQDATALTDRQHVKKNDA